jgi:hypothetical protein
MAMLCAWFCGTFLTGFAPSPSNEHHDTITHLLRIYEDDDFINIWGKGTHNIPDHDYQPDDYPWPGELIALRSRYSILANMLNN